MILEALSTMKRSEIERFVRGQTRGISMPGGETLCRVLGEYPMVVTLEDLSVAPHLVMDGYWEMWVTMCLAKQFAKHPERKKWNSIDVGANFGYYTLLLAMLAPEGNVEAWEPQLSLHPYLEKTLRLNGLIPRVRQRCDAAGQTETLGSYVCKKFDRGSVCMEVNGSGFTPVLPITHTMLESVDFVKIDAEGMEPDIWRGGMRELRPKAVLLEWTPSKYGSTRAKAFLDEMRSDGYVVSLVNQHGDLDAVSDEKLLSIVGWEALWVERS